MATIIKFNEAEIENAVGGTVDLVTSPVELVERDSDEYVTVYLQPIDGVQHYFTLTNEDWEKIKNPSDVRKPKVPACPTCGLTDKVSYVESKRDFSYYNCRRCVTQFLPKKG